MNYLTILMVFLFSFQQPEIKLLEINAEWNKRNDVKLSTLPKEYNGIPIKKDYALLENQAPKLKATINAVPVIILIIDGKLKSQWTADLSFQLKLDKEEVIEALDWHFKSYSGTAGSTIVAPKRRKTTNN
tara:strand:+ start:54 stop:443 length:390 start_codon:yes stop_codon:yes gene_type:complete